MVPPKVALAMLVWFRLPVSVPVPARVPPLTVRPAGAVRLPLRLKLPLLEVTRPLTVP